MNMIGTAVVCLEQAGAVIVLAYLLCLYMYVRISLPCMYACQRVYFHYTCLIVRVLFLIIMYCLLDLNILLVVHG